MEEDRRSAIHTMKTDAEELLKKEKSSFLDLFAKQADAPIVRSQAQQQNNSLMGIVAIVAVVVALGAIGFAGYIYISRNRNTPPNQTEEWKPPRPILNAEEILLITIRAGDRTGILNAFGQARRKTLPEGAYRYMPLVVADINVEAHNASPTELFTALGIAPPSDFLDSFTGRWNAYTTGTDDLVFIFELKDRVKAQGSLLRWEDAMIGDFIPIIAGVEPGAYEFKDGIVKNIDTRVARLSKTRDASVGYAIALGRYLIIATREASLVGTISRLIAQPSVE